MTLKSLEITGFKSFGRKTVLNFTAPITAIVGPNGSGKSNVAEAFRFVLGEQSMKSMRGKKGEDLIFSGSSEAPRSSRAGVKLVFDNSQKLFAVDFDEVSIERVVLSDGSNEYAINGSKVRLKDISELLAQANIGASGHHIISQGEADRILHASPREKREMIEDALGIKIYEYKKEESERKLQKTDENIRQVESLRREIAPHLRFLKKQVEKVEKSRQMREELISASRIYFKIESLYIGEAKENLQNKKKAPELELRVLETELLAARKAVEAGVKDRESTPEILALEASLSETRTRKDSLVRDLGRLEGEISFSAKALEREEKALHEDESKTVSLKEVEQLEREVAERLSGAERDTESLQNCIADIQKIIRHFIERNKQSTPSSSLQALKVEISALKEKKTQIEVSLEDVRKEEEALLRAYNQKKEEIEKAKDESREAEKKIFEIIAKQNEARNALQRLESEERLLQTDEVNLKNDIGDISTLCGVEVLRFEEEFVTNDGKNRAEQTEKRKHIERLRIRLEEAGVAGGADIEKEFKETEERDVFLARELVDLEEAKNDLVRMIAELTERLDKEFKEGVQKINSEFHTFFTAMFGGGKASLSVVRANSRRKSVLPEGEVENPEEKVEEGLEVEVSLPHKKIKGLMMLSGGERALTSIALLFAISQVNPPPFVILDETDAALDESNSRKYGDMVESLAKHSELIVITHNRETMSRAGVLYGVTMGRDAVSKVLSIEFAAAEAMAK